MINSINKQMVEELKVLMEDDFQVLIETFLCDCEQRLIDLNIAISENNANAIREIAHGFKGSCSNLGAEKLSEISFTLETMGRTDDLADANKANALLSDEYRLVKDYFNSII